MYIYIYIYTFIYIYIYMNKLCEDEAKLRPLLYKVIMR